MLRTYSRYTQILTLIPCNKGQPLYKNLAETPVGPLFLFTSKLASVNRNFLFPYYLPLQLKVNQIASRHESRRFR